LYDKPTHIGEFGLGGDGSGLGVLDPTGIHVHNNMWGSLFGGGLGTGMSWWWDSYIEPKNLYPVFNGPAAISAQIPLKEKAFRPSAATISGAPGDLKLNVSLGWSGLGDTLIQINSAGVITPSNYALGQFLYGSSWNTQFRRPPVFSIDMPQAGQFKVIVGGQLGTSPSLRIWLDGTQVLSTSPAVNQTYTINVPAGQHTIKVDNLGTDWMTIANYVFEGLGSSVNAFMLKSEDQTHLAGWMLNTDYNHVFVKANGAPDAVSGSVLTVGNMANGNYFAKWYDCQTGAFLQGDPVTVSNQTLVLPLPELIWDLALVLDGQAVGTSETVQALPVSVFPNPVSESPVTISFALQNAENVDIALFDAAGVAVQNLFSGKISAGEHAISAQIARDLTPGIYWIQISAGKQRAAKALGIVR
jgi:hypothetical protein